ncbi:hypothetical protein V2W30_09165 [Streptomyces sp. Q6]|uniref:Uncharacterized protein n=1 Tax=Streptomyces citrinus TaxID=3118173 RepID=A0ACD5A8L7_9ACTN
MTLSDVLPSLASKLIDEAEKDRERAAHERAAGIVGLPLPELSPRALRPFPDRPGRRHDPDAPGFPAPLIEES